MALKQLFVINNKVLIDSFVLSLICGLPYLFEHHTILSIVGVVGMAAVFAVILSVLYNALKPLKLHAVLFWCIIVIMVFLAEADVFCIFNFGFIVNDDVLQIIRTSSTSDVKGFISVYFSWEVVLTLISFLLLSFFTILYVHKNNLMKKIHTRPVKYLAIVGVLVCIYSLFSYLIFNDLKGISETNPITRLLFSSLKNSNKDIEKLCDFNKNVIAECDIPKDKRPIFVVVLGESFSPYHSSLYGYDKDTNPLLKRRADNNELIVYEDVISRYDVTWRVMNSIISTDSFGLDFFHKPLCPVLFRKAGYSTKFFSNQWLVGQSNFAITNRGLSNLMFDNRNDKLFKYDMDMVQECIANSIEHHNAFYLIHLMGQHYTYSDRYPPEFGVFKADDYPSKLLTKNQKTTIADYDNATLYNDYVIDEIIKIFEREDCILFYFSDHGEEVYDLRNFAGHGSCSDTPDISYQLKVPFIVWTSALFKENHSYVVEKLTRASHYPFITEYVPMLLINIASITTDSYSPYRCIISDDYVLDKPRITQHNINYDEVQRKGK